MTIELSETPITSVADLARVPIAFKVERIYDVMPHPHHSGGFTLSERLIDVPYVKDYDRIDGEGPAQWSKRLDISMWCFIRAQLNARLVGGIVIAFDTPDAATIEGRGDLAVLWDVRVSPNARGQGIGSALFRAAESRAMSKGCRQLEVETQTINVPACRFYERQGFVLRTVDPFAYPQLPGETRLLWYKDLPARRREG